MRRVYIIYIRAIYYIYNTKPKIANLTFSIILLNFRCARLRKEENIGTG